MYFWSDRCASQFRLKYVFQSLSFYPSWLEVFWDYGEAHHFKVPHDGIGGMIKRKFYHHVSSGKVIITDAKQFTTYANEISTVKVKYIDKSEIVFLNLDDAIYIHDMLKIHHVERVNETNLDFYLNSLYKHEPVKHQSITFQSNKSSSMAKQPSSSQSTNPPATRQPSEPVSTDQAVDHGLIEIPYDSVSISQWVTVLYEGEVFLDKVLNKQNDTVLVWCLSKPFGINEPQDFE